tara:strand:- start:444 stop:857 length:414 start_codon:yes stop_codon:yes gene_type:complete
MVISVATATHVVGSENSWMRDSIRYLRLLAVRTREAQNGRQIISTSIAAITTTAGLICIKSFAKALDLHVIGAGTLAICIPLAWKQREAACRPHIGAAILNRDSVLPCHDGCLLSIFLTETNYIPTRSLALPNWLGM